MKRISGWLIGDQKYLVQKNMIWNMLGSAVYSLTSMLLGTAVIRIAGEDLGGVFSFAFGALGQQMFIVAYFGIRPIQITDMGFQYSFGDYRRFRACTCLLAVISGILFALFYCHTATEKWVVGTMVCYKVIDGFADVYESEFQRNGKLYLTGKSNAFRTLLSVGVFLGVLRLTQNLTAACVMAVLAQFAGFILMNQQVIVQLHGIDYTVHSYNLKRLWKDSRWIFLSAFLDLYIFSSSRYAIQTHMEQSASAYFSTIFIPTSVINLAAGFVIRPFLTMLSERWERSEVKAFAKIVLSIGGVIAVLTMAGMAAAYWVGIPVLAALLGPAAGAGIQPYRAALVINIAGGGFYAVLNLLYYVLVIMKDQQSIFLIYGFGGCLAFVMSGFFVKWGGITGGAISYCLLMVILTALFVIAAARRYRRGRFRF